MFNKLSPYFENLLISKYSNFNFKLLYVNYKLINYGFTDTNSVNQYISNKVQYISIVTINYNSK